MEQREVQGVTYYLSRRRGMRNLRLRMDKQGLVMVSAPYSASVSKIDAFVSKYADKIKQFEKSVPQHTYQTGDSILLLGKERSLEVRIDPLLKKTIAQYRIEDEKIVVIVCIEDIGLVKATIKQMYIDTVQKVLESRVQYWVDRVQAGPVSSFGVNRAKTKWGVCYPKERRLYLSYMCAILPYELIDMTVLHEVCHLKIAGHGPRFWALMKAYMPDLDKRKAQLREVSKMGLSYNLV